MQAVMLRHFFPSSKKLCKFSIHGVGVYPIVHCRPLRQTSEQKEKKEWEAKGGGGGGGGGVFEPYNTPPPPEKKLHGASGDFAPEMQKSFTSKIKKSPCINLP